MITKTARSLVAETPEALSPTWTLANAVARALSLIALLLTLTANVFGDDTVSLAWEELPSLPNELGVAGPIAVFTTTR